MASPVFLDSGTDATQDLTFYASSTGTVASATDQAHTGPRSIKLSTGAGPTTANIRTGTGVLADTGTRVSRWLYFDTLPAVTSNVTIGLKTDAATSVWRLQLNTLGNVVCTPLGATAVTGATVLAVNTWYQLSIAYTITDATHFRFDFYVNGVSQGSVTAGTLTNVGSSILQMNAPSGWGANINVWCDDIYVDDGTDYADPGPVRVTHKRPNANGAANNFSTQIGAGGSGYGSGHAPQVNEQPLSQTNGWSMIGAGSAITEEYLVENTTTGDVSLQQIAIVGVMGWIFAKSALAETGQIVVDGAATNIALTTTATLFTKVSATPTLFPSGSGADIGIVTSTTVTTVSLYEAGVLIAYIPVTSTPSLTLLGVQ